ncbi:SUN domain-containing protein 3 [Trametes pubescens]|uniref:SUN domain-containing protein 3 n=1 Tax=Trametes pubescens TaxID=154538 RepID=A0A1M2VNG3_TRAPU|nr:SUN domain-containing protein 3 [Trametes pubescens]
MLTGFEIYSVKGFVEFEPLFQFLQDVSGGPPVPISFLHSDHALMGGTSNGKLNIWDIYSRKKQPLALDGSRKITRFASNTSISSDREEPDLPPLTAPSTSRTPAFLPTALAIFLLLAALGIHLLRISNSSSPLSLRLRLPWRSEPAGTELVLSPALKTAIEELVISTVHAERIARRGLPDYALRANGGRVAVKLTSGHSRDNDPSVAIDDDVHAGKCWKIDTLPSQLGIRLSRMIHPTHVTVEHLPAEIAVDMDRAPKNVMLWGAVDGAHNKELFAALMAAQPPAQKRAPTIVRGQLWAPLATFIYDIHADNPIQTFPISQPFVDTRLAFGVVAVEVLDNWGGDSTFNMEDVVGNIGFETDG